MYTLQDAGAIANIASAIRDKLGIMVPYSVPQMADAIHSIPSFGGVENGEAKTVVAPLGQSIPAFSFFTIIGNEGSVLNVQNEEKLDTFKLSTSDYVKPLPNDTFVAFTEGVSGIKFGKKYDNDVDYAIYNVQDIANANGLTHLDNVLTLGGNVIYIGRDSKIHLVKYKYNSSLDYLDEISYTGLAYLFKLYDDESFGYYIADTKTVYIYKVVDDAFEYVREQTISQLPTKTSSYYFGVLSIKNFLCVMDVPSGQTGRVYYCSLSDDGQEISYVSYGNIGTNTTSPTLFIKYQDENMFIVGEGNRTGITNDSYFENNNGSMATGYFRNTGIKRVLQNVIRLGKWFISIAEISSSAGGTITRRELNISEKTGNSAQILQITDSSDRGTLYPLGENTFCYITGNKLRLYSVNQEETLAGLAYTLEQTFDIASESSPQSYISAGASSQIMRTFTNSFIIPFRSNTYRVIKLQVVPNNALGIIETSAGESTTNGLTAETITSAGGIGYIITPAENS